MSGKVIYLWNRKLSTYPNDDVYTESDERIDEYVTHLMLLPQHERDQIIGMVRCLEKIRVD